MPFDIAYWKEAVKAYLPQAKEGFKRGVYTTLGAASFLPLLLAFQNPASTGPALMALWNILSGLGSNILANKMQAWAASDPPDLDRLAEILQQTTEENAQAREELDAVIRTLEAADQAHAELCEGDKAWFQETLQQELKQLNSNPRHIYTNTYFETVILQHGDFVLRDKITYILNQGEDVTPQVESYYRNLSARCQLLPLGIIDEKYIQPQGEVQIKLQDIYTDLDVAAIAKEKDEDTLHYGWRLSRAEEGDREAILQAISRDDLPLITLLGDAGSGKTTFVNYLTYRLLSHPEGLTETLQDRPILRLVLRDVLPFLSKGKQADTAEILWKALRADIQKRVGETTAPKVLLALQKKICETPSLLLLDGLDEIPEAHTHRQHLLKAIQDLLNCLPEGSRVILTARPYAYADDKWQLPGFSVRTLKPFSDEQANHFISAWYEHIPSPLDESRLSLQNRADSLMEAIKEKEYLGAMASRPILLTLMTTLHTSHGTLPEDRAELYDDAVNLLIDRWQQKSRIDLQKKDNSSLAAAQDPRVQKVFQFGTARVRRVMEGIAFDSHQKQQFQQKEDPDAQVKSADITRTELESAFSKILPDDLNPRIVVDYMAQHAGLLIPREPGIFIFPHRSFQEFLAACHLLNQPESSQRLLKLIDNDLNWWREVYLLAVGRQKSTSLDNAVSLISVLRQDSVNDMLNITDQDWHTAALAGEGLLEIRLMAEPETSKAYAGLIDRIRGWLTKLVAEGHLLPNARLAAGDILGILGDFRKGVNVIIHEDVVLPDIDWVPIPAGEFLMGSAESDQNAFIHEKQQHPVDLAAYWISRYPLTNAQFEPFVRAKGYQVRDFWTDPGWAWRNGEDRDFSDVRKEGLREALENNQSLRPKDQRAEPIFWRRQPWNGPNRPVVGISWYEAHAYTQWLTYLLQQSPAVLPEGIGEVFTITLPSEAEWEKAVRGSEGLIYPWENEWRVDAANTAETDLNTTSPVGIFPKGKSAPFELLDGAGNVWEWTRSLWGKDWEKPDFDYPYDPGDSARENLESTQVRVVRGGSFDLFHDLARCAGRDGFDPDGRYDFIGFRLCLRP